VLEGESLKVGSRREAKTTKPKPEVYRKCDMVQIDNDHSLSVPSPFSCRAPSLRPLGLNCHVSGRKGRTSKPVLPETFVFARTHWAFPGILHLSFKYQAQRRESEYAVSLVG
jgi:hypothetical protein